MGLIFFSSGVISFRRSSGEQGKGQPPRDPASRRSNRKQDEAA
ncbi:hypothetical protein [Paracoccus yeei]